MKGPPEDSSASAAEDPSNVADADPVGPCTNPTSATDGCAKAAEVKTASPPSPSPPPPSLVGEMKGEAAVSQDEEGLDCGFASEEPTAVVCVEGSATAAGGGLSVPSEASAVTDSDSAEASDRVVADDVVNEDVDDADGAAAADPDVAARADAGDTAMAEANDSAGAVDGVFRSDGDAAAEADGSAAAEVDVLAPDYPARAETDNAAATADPAAPEVTAADVGPDQTEGDNDDGVPELLAALPALAVGGAVDPREESQDILADVPPSDSEYEEEDIGPDDADGTNNGNANAAGEEAEELLGQEEPGEEEIGPDAMALPPSLTDFEAGVLKLEEEKEEAVTSAPAALGKPAPQSCPQRRAPEPSAEDPAEDPAAHTPSLSSSLSSHARGAAVAPAPPSATLKPLVSVLKKPAVGVPKAMPSSLLLLSLPTDSLHTVASFLETTDWARLATTSRGSSRACREVFRRVRMHGFRCATEAITAWVRGEHGDARELVALYIRSGVPIYPLCLGHSYHTLTWRMGIEAREMERRSAIVDAVADNNGTAGNNAADDNVEADLINGAADVSANLSLDEAQEGNTSVTAKMHPKLDRFYTERYEARSRDGYYSPHLTFLEEKCLFWKYRAEEEEEAESRAVGRHLSAERRHSLSNAVSLRPPPVPAPGMGGAHQQMPMGGGPIFPPRGADAQGIGGAGGLPAFPPGAGGPPFLPPPPAHGPPQAFGRLPPGAPLGPPRRTLSASNLRGEGLGGLPPPSSYERGVSHPNASTSAAPRHPKTVVRVHRHLVDQHLLGRQAVNDEGGGMESGPLSLSADFFHPHLTSGAGAGGYHGAVVHPSNAAYCSDAYMGAETLTGAPIGLRLRSPSRSGSLPHDLPGVGPIAGIDLPWNGEDGVAGVGQDVPAEEGGTNANANATEGAGGPAPLQFHVDLANAPQPEGFHASETRWPVPLSARHLQHAVSFGPGPDLSSVGHRWGGPHHLELTSPECSAVMDVSLEIYSSSSYGLPKGTDDRHPDDSGGVPLGLSSSSPSRLRHLRTRFLWYQRKLDHLLAHFDSFGFDECLLDFWDEFLPLTEGVHYYDRFTPVPRMSSINRFLTRPCPKAIGIVQCEIERIKISGRKGKRGVGVKGRLFPTYQYRLFVRDRRFGGVESSTGPPGEVRRDTVLMTAKNRGKSAGVAAAAAAAGVVGSPSPSSSGKRGVNNYFLYTPQTSDIESHFRSVNDSSIFHDEKESSPKPFQRLPQLFGSRQLELGRLQSNFIGTEFQIFTPCLVKARAPHGRSSVPSRLSSQIYSDDSDDENPLPGDDSASNRSGQSGSYGRGQSQQELSSSSRRGRRRGSFSQRLSSAARRSLSRPRGGRGRSDTNSSGGVPDAGIEADDAPPSPTDTTPTSVSGRRKKRRGSWPSLGRPGKGTSRRAIANSAGNGAGSVEPVMGEEENGAIVYTANLLGNRPRIMDVCIPRVGEDGLVSSDWRRQGEDSSDDESSPESMMARFKQLQSQLENATAAGGQENNNNDNGNGGGQNNAGENPAGAGGAEGNVTAGENSTVPGSNSANNNGLMVLQNRPPWWNVELGAFVLNFGGRVSVASVKNFQLCDTTDQDHIMLQFGRIQGRHSFTMDFQYPLSAVQAFAIAISSLQSKISFG